MKCFAWLSAGADWSGGGGEGREGLGGSGGGGGGSSSGLEEPPCPTTTSKYHDGGCSSVFLPHATDLGPRAGFRATFRGHVKLASKKNTQIFVNYCLPAPPRRNCPHPINHQKQLSLVEQILGWYVLAIWIRSGKPFGWYSLADEPTPWGPQKPGCGKGRPSNPWGQGLVRAEEKKHQQYWMCGITCVA